MRNPAYSSTFVFDNDFAALKPGTPLDRFEQDGLLVAESEPGLCRVVCFSPRHNLTIANMDAGDLRKVVDTWVEQYQELGARPEINYVQIFENRGAMMGASNPHPHCQIWSSHAMPNEVAKEQESLLGWREQRGTCLLCEYARLELAGGERVVEENEAFLTVVPFWAVWPFETMVIAKRHISSIEQLTGEERDGLADILQRTTARYDRLFTVSFPYSMGFHQRPTDGGGARRASLTPAFLSAATAFGNGAQVPGGLRNAGDAAARYHGGIGGVEIARGVTEFVLTKL